MTKPLRIIYAGTPEFALAALEALTASRHEVIAVYTQPDRPAGRGRQLNASPVKHFALNKTIFIQQPQTLKDTCVQAQLRAYDADVMVVAAYGLILPPSVLGIPRYGCLNLHASLLPRWRGAAPIQRAILAGDDETGITLMQMAPGLDTGDMLLRRTCPIAADDTAQRLHDRLARLSAEVLLEGLNALQAGELNPVVQDESLATYAPKLNKHEARLDWSLPATQLDRCVRAFNPWPVAHTLYQGESLRIWEAHSRAEPTQASPGTVLAESETGIDVATGAGILCLKRLQRAGGKPMHVDDFLKARSFLGVCFD